jgi:hypothetical protein
MTATEAQNLTGVERAMALDILDADGIDRLTEDEDGIFTEDEATLDFTDVPDYVYFGSPENYPY